MISLSLSIKEQSALWESCKYVNKDVTRTFFLFFSPWILFEQLQAMRISRRRSLAAFLFFFLSISSFEKCVSSLK